MTTSDKNLALLQAIQRKGMTQRELAKVSTVSEITLSRIINRKHTPRQDTQQLIAGALNTTVDELFADE